MTAFRYYLLVVVLSLLPLISFFTTQDLPHTHDGLVHLPRIAAYFKALSDGQIPVRWVGDLNYGYGMPLFNFIYQLPYFISSLFLVTGVGLVDSFKLTVSLSYLLSGIFMLLFARAFFKDPRKALLVTIFYQFAPFRLVELLGRGSFGEVYTYAFLPLVLYGLTKGRVVLTSFATALLILSHNSVSLLFFAVVVGFALFFLYGKPRILGMAGLLSGLILSAFYWVPALVEYRYTYGDLFMRKLYLEHFADIWKFFVPNLTNDKALQIGSISLGIGLFHTIAIPLAVFILLRRKIDKRIKRLFIFSLPIFIFSLVFTQPISKIFWENISFLRQFQFPWRFLSLIVFATSMLSAAFLSFGFLKKNWAYFLLLTLLIGSTVFYWRPNEGYDRIDEGYYWNFPLNTTYYGETDVIWSAGPKGAYPKERIEVIAGEAKIKDFTKKSNLHTFTIDAETDAGLVDHTQYFPGWRVYVDGNSIPIQFQDPNWRGEIEFAVAKGAHEVEVKFGETKLRLISNIISFAGLCLLLLCQIYQYILNRYIRR